jgi:hypothetical protein
MKIEFPYSYHGWKNCVKISNQIVDIIATTEIGPRIIYYGFSGERNEFVEFEETLGKKGGDQWHSYGGHRFWYAPEHPIRTYYPDNEEVLFEKHSNFIRLTQQIEPDSKIQKEIDITIDDNSSKVTVVHRIYNHSLWSLELAPWALSVMAPGGVAIAPLPERKAHPKALLPVNSISFWAYTNMSDSRWTWGHELIMLEQRTDISTPQKVGIFSLDGWVAYANSGHLFVKTFEPEIDYLHPDFNSNIELFTNSKMLEVETLGALVELEPETSIEYSEEWILFDKVDQPIDEESTKKDIVPMIKRIQNKDV